ncbi:MAG TPA: hypothetical protein VE783_07710 [Candidatus Limnocylindrales bacterium]|jgi:hypothetical protein|nr:hypothetical protein [Candidatus Limnocylindrales bacterium]
MATIRCDQHGVSHEAFVCKHLVYGKYLGFFCDLDDHGNPFPDAWCNGCELIRLEYQGWSDATEDLMEIAMVCGGCYEEIKERNLLGSESSSALQ